MEMTFSFNSNESHGPWEYIKKMNTIQCFKIIYQNAITGIDIPIWMTFPLLELVVIFPIKWNEIPIHYKRS